MPLDFPAVLNHASPIQTFRWEDRDSMLYAISLGFGSDPLDRNTLRFVYEDPTDGDSPLKTVPTFPTVVAWVASPTFSELGVDPITALHSGQKIVVHRPITYPAVLTVQGRVLNVYDKGQDRGAIVLTEHVLSSADDGLPVATLTTSCFGRAEGGGGGSADPVPRPHSVPLRRADRSIDISTPGNLALLYRLTGDRNPIHADPLVARAAGFDRPILHGLCTFGITCRAVLESFADFDPDRIISHEARFSSPVYPGEILTVDLWRDADVVSFEARVADRDVTVISNGRCELRS